MLRFATLLTFLLLMVGSAACGDDDARVVGDGGGGAVVGAPGGRDDGLFVSVEEGGGLLPVGHDFRTLPRAVVYEDGHTFSPGATIEIYPGPAVHPIVEGQIGAEAVRSMVEAAENAGLLHEPEPDFGEPPIADAATTTITVVVDGKSHVTSVYALMSNGGTLPGMESRPIEARQRVSAFVDLVAGAALEGERNQYAPERYRVLPLAPEQFPADHVQPDERDWPFPGIALTERECVAVIGEQAEAFRDALQDATEITRWRAPSGTAFVLVVRPVLPHEPDCPDLANLPRS